MTNETRDLANMTITFGSAINTYTHIVLECPVVHYGDSPPEQANVAHDFDTDTLPEIIISFPHHSYGSV